MYRNVKFVKVAAAIGSCAAGSFAHAGQTAQTPGDVKPQASASNARVWTSDPVLATSLGAEVKAFSYAMRIPIGFNETAAPVDLQELRKNGVDSHLYNSARLPDGTAASLGITVATVPPKYAGKVALADALAHMVSQKKEAWQDFSATHSERGTIGGVTFLRTYYKGVIATPKGKVDMRGIAYAAVDDKYIVALEAEDVATHYDTSHPLLEAAILTFHKP